MREVFQTGNEVVKELAKTGKPILLAFSCGKDSLAAWIKLRGQVDVVPVYRYLIPGLEFVADAIVYYERAFQTTIRQVSHDSLFRWLNNLVFQSPERCLAIEDSELPRQGRDDWRESVCADAGLPRDTWCAVTNILTVLSWEKRLD